MRKHFSGGADGAFSLNNNCLSYTQLSALIVSIGI